jgi:hypothetical protein
MEARAAAKAAEKEALHAEKAVTLEQNSAKKLTTETQRTQRNSLFSFLLCELCASAVKNLFSITKVNDNFYPHFYIFLYGFIWLRQKVSKNG